MIPSEEDDEAKLRMLATRLLATPHKPRSESKIGRVAKKKKLSGAKSRAISAKPKSVPPSA